MSSSDTFDQIEHIAIIGMACRFPGANAIGQYWQNIRDGIESISFFADQALEAEAPGHVALSNPDFVEAAGLLEDIDLFDSLFFGFSSAEAEVTDPQHRTLLECAWEALESAGYSGDSYGGRIGVYAGATISTYLLNNVIANPEAMGLVGRARSIMGNDSNFLTTWLSYKLNLNGPSIAVQTACSSSLVAVHLACQSLLNGECDMALAGGVSISVPQRACYEYREGGIHSPDGHCRTFDANASGTVGGSGLGIVVLKRLADALADGDSIQAIIKGSAINNDGSFKIGYTAPSVCGQADVINEALAMAGVNPETITYVEAHGTATPIGDAIEIAALTQAFRRGTSGKNFCAIGSVKTNIGHLDTASGVAGLIKTVLALKHKLIPPSLHFQRPNPMIDFANSPFYVNAQLSEWAAGPTARRAGVSSLGIGGTNAHVIVEEAPQREASAPSNLPQLLVLSAKTSTALDTATLNLVEAARESPGMNLGDMAYTLQLGRKAFDHRRIAICHGLGDAVTILREHDLTRVWSSLREGAERPITFLFTGQGSKFISMGVRMYEERPLFRHHVDECAKLIKLQTGLDLRKALYSRHAAYQESANRLEQTSFRQLTLFVTEYALAKMWMSLGVHPQAMIGEGVGKYVAACLAGIFTLEEGLWLAAAIEPSTELLSSISLLAPKIAYLSNLTGKRVSIEQATDPDHWACPLRQAIESDGILEEILKEPRRILLGIGPSQMLSRLASEHLSMNNGRVVVSSLREERGQGSDEELFLSPLGQLWLAGVKIDWAQLYLGTLQHRIQLPTYPFERQRHWIEAPNAITTPSLNRPHLRPTLV
jgi:acyl transferase domain-containing protein